MPQGIAGTAERDVSPNTIDTLLGVRAALYVITGFAGLGVIIALAFHVVNITTKEIN